uniref:Phosphatidylinositol N-acetylglucosaminyltransferase subunit H conserved domain-containing protein n=1 Tax=Lotharella oceanica TaxID=641309 RepID=A0A7S2TFK4_9EUKA|mmetsp:Transcript_1004/g.1856  ORF Transcript_1004/g.1856 Transcript_1004/m.1856 type:complete len:177 (+) Transcript_1004:101-631(+)
MQRRATRVTQLLLDHSGGGEGPAVGSLHVVRVPADVGLLLAGGFCAVLAVLGCYEALANTDAILGVASGLLVPLILMFINAGIPRQESVEVRPRIGIRLEKERMCGSAQSFWIPKEDVEDVVINEGFRNCRVVYYAAVFVRDSNKKPKPVLMFQSIDSLSLEDLVPVRNSVLACCT